jgi:hypothetical protein
MVRKYNNERSSQLKELESKQGTTYFPGNIFVHTDNKGFKRLYLLNAWQRIFMFFEDPKLSICGSWFGSIMLVVIGFNLIVFIVSTLPEFKETPTTCANPACNYDMKLCPNKVVCEPEPLKWTQTAELICVIVFTIEYLSRIILVSAMPPRLANILLSVKKKESAMGAIFTTNKPSAKDELFAYAKLRLAVSEQDSAHSLMNEASGITKVVDENTSISVSGKSDNSSTTIEMQNKVKLFLSEDDKEESELRPVFNSNSNRNQDYDDDEVDDGYQLADMNIPVHDPAASSLTDQRTGRPSAVFTTTPNLNINKSNINSNSNSNCNEIERTKKYDKYAYQPDDELADLDRKSLGMDKSHRYTWYYKVYAYASKALNIIDLIAIIPFFLEYMLDSSDNETSLSIVRVLRLARVFRIFKMGKGNAGVQMLGKTVYVSAPALALLAFFIILGVILFGALIFFIEGGVYTVSTKFSKGAYVIEDFFGELIETTYTSIISSIYWAVVVTTTTGYGDMVPYSFSGKLVAILCAYYGFLLLALPITVIGNNFDKILNAQQGKDNEQFIYECLLGITKSIDVEYRARSKMLPPPSNAYKMTLVTAIISTFDSTKQSLLKDAILLANRNAVELRRLEAEGKEDDGNIISREGTPINVMIPDSEPDSEDDSGYEDNASNTWTKRGFGDDEMISLRSASPDTQKEKGGNNSKSAKVVSSSSKTNTSTIDIAANTNTNNNVLNNSDMPASQISWTKMPKMPDKKKPNFNFFSPDYVKVGKTPHEELELAMKELKAATDEWAVLCSPPENVKMKNFVSSNYNTKVNSTNKSTNNNNNNNNNSKGNSRSNSIDFTPEF